MSNRLLIRTDGDERIGTGHVMRCLALAQAWRCARGGQATFLCSGLPAPLGDRLRSESLDVRRLAALPATAADSAETCAVADRLAASWIVVDGYHFGADYQARVTRAGHRLLAIDDFGHGAPYSAQLVLNPNASADPRWHGDRLPQTGLLLGARYILLRDEFSAAVGRPKLIVPRARRVLVSYGGADAGDLTRATVLALDRAAGSDIELLAVVGGAYGRFTELCGAVARTGRPWRTEQNVARMADRMAWADVAISAAGSTTWELAALGVPSVLVVTAENQRPGADFLAREKLGIVIGRGATWTVDHVVDAALSLAADAAARRGLSRRMQGWVDGRGAARVVEAMTRRAAPAVCSASPPVSNTAFRPARDAGRSTRDAAMHDDSVTPISIHLSRLSDGDLELVRRWRNDPEIAQFAANRDEISAERQREWFRSIDNDDHFYFMISVAGEKTGVVNLKQVDWSRRTAESGIYIVHPQHRNGYVAMQVVMALLDFAFDDLGLETVFAHILRANTRAVRFNRKLGYTLVPDQDGSDNPLYAITRASFTAATAELREFLERTSGMTVSLDRGRPGDRSAA